MGDKHGKKAKLLKAVKSPPHEGLGIYVLPGATGTIDSSDPLLNGTIVEFDSGVYRTRLLLQDSDFEVIDG